MAAETKKQTCPECGKKLLHVGVHMKNVHGIAGGLSGKARSRNGTSPKFKGLKVETDFIVLSDDQGNMWLAERIR